MNFSFMILKTIATQPFFLSKERRMIRKFNFNCSCIVHLLGKGIPPTLKISKTNFQFGECPLNE
jgi:hypothetical protein